MFAKQQGSGTAQTTKSVKRKRSKTPPLKVDSDDSDVQIIEPSTSQPPAKSQKLNIWEDDSDVEYVDRPQSQSKPGQSSSSAREISVRDVLSMYAHVILTSHVHRSIRILPISQKSAFLVLRIPRP